MLLLALQACLTWRDTTPEETGSPTGETDSGSGADADQDGHGEDDCDDGDPAIHPGATETWYDGVDQDCDGNDGDRDGDGWWIADYANLAGVVLPEGTVDGDCWDDPSTTPTEYSPVGGQAALTAAEVHPDAEDLAYDGIDADCAGDDDFDADGDGAASDSVADRDGAYGEDCDDGDPDVSPTAVESCATADVDDDCDGDLNDPDAELCSAFYVDADGDEFGSDSSACLCEPDEIHTTDESGDCDDDDPAAHPYADEGPADGLDSDCDGEEQCWTDGDGDGHGGEEASSEDLSCTATGFAPNGDDCDDARADVSPDATETPADGVDGDCDGFELCWLDADADGYGGDSTLATVIDCSAEGVAANSDDCDDTAAAVHPDAEETPADGVDADCDGLETCYTDLDGDGYGQEPTLESAEISCSSGAAPNADDCDDDDPAVNPGAEERCDGEDDDCSGYADDGATDAGTWYLDDDGDGFGDPEEPLLACEAAEGLAELAGDCDDADAAVNPEAEDVCDDGVDGDCDGRVEDGCGLAALSGPDDATLRVVGEPLSGLGAGLATGADLGGDGDVDLAVGFDRSGDGAIALFDGPLADPTALADAYATLAPVEGATTGRSLLLASDLDGDGADDLVVGEALSSDGSLYGGCLSLFSGPLSGDLDADADRSLAVCGAEAGIRLGAALDLGDVEHDGEPELVAGAPSAGAAGLGGVYLFDDLAAAADSDDASVILEATSLGTRLGEAVALLADADGDGLDELAVGAPGESVLSAREDGRVYVFSGADLSGVLSTGDASWLLDAEGEGDTAGSALASAGDGDGDGLCELAVGAPAAAGSGADLGAGRVYTVGLAGWVGNRSLADADASFIGSASAGLGAQLSPVEGAAGPGVPGFAASASGRGLVALFAAPYAGTHAAEDVAWAAISSDGLDLLGEAMAWGSDLDGDGFVDLVVGAPGAEGVAGAALVFGGGGL